MKFKNLFLCLMILILACGIVAIAAEEDYGSIGDYTFDIPTGYEISESSDNNMTLQQDSDHVIVMSIPDALRDSDELKSELEEDGYEFGDEDNYKVGNFDISQYNYNKDSYQGFLYICDDGKSDIVITLVVPGDEEAPSPDDNPVTQIVNSLE